MNTNRLDNQTFITTIIVLAFVLVIFVWMFFPPQHIDQTEMAVINILIGALVSNVNTVISFFFGSSKGSKDKDDALAKMSLTPREPPTTINFPSALSKAPDAQPTETKP